MSAAEQGRARQAIAYVAQTLRPDWGPAGITAAIEALYRDGQTLGIIARATVSAALTPSTKTPGGIAARIRDGFDGAETKPRTPTAPKLDDLRCRRCGGLKPEGDDAHREHCLPRTDPDRAHDLAAEARDHIRPTVSYETEEASDG